MSTKVMLYKVSLEGHKDVIAFLGEQDARTFTQIIFAGKDQYQIAQSSVDVEELGQDYDYAISNDEGKIVYDIVFFKEAKMRNIFVLTLLFAMAGLSIESFDAAQSHQKLDELGRQLDTLGSREIPLSWIEDQAKRLKKSAIA